MPTWLIVLIIVLVIVVAVGAYFALRFGQRRRTEQLRGQFGPEYDRAVAERGDRGGAEADLVERQRRRQQLDIRPLDPDARARYADAWRAAQTQFVDRPGDAVQRANRLVIEVMRERGYPVDDFERRAADVSVDHPTVVDNYRAAHAIAEANVAGTATTEELRRAVVHYRVLFGELLEDGEEPRQSTEVPDERA
jgi:hypothetical protein